MSKKQPNSTLAADATLASQLIEQELPRSASAAVKRARLTLIEFVAQDAEALAALSPAALRIVTEHV